MLSLKHIALVPLFLFSYSFGAKALSPREIDSLWHVANNKQSPVEERIRALFVLHLEYDDENPPYCLEIVTKTEQLSNEKNYTIGTGIAKTMFANAWTYIKNKDSTLSYRFESVRILKASSGPLKDYFLGQAYRYLASILADMGKRDTAVILFNEALRSANLDGNVSDQLTIL
jgi:hypothetical protein